MNERATNKMYQSRMPKLNEKSDYSEFSQITKWLGRDLIAELIHKASCIII